MWGEAAKDESISDLVSRDFEVMDELTKVTQPRLKMLESASSPLRRCAAQPRLTVPVVERRGLPPPIGVLCGTVSEGSAPGRPQKAFPAGSFGRRPGQHACNDRAGEFVGGGRRIDVPHPFATAMS